MLLDVVYNHLGPSGNYLAEFGPYFTDSYQTPWGPAVNLDDAGSDEVRAFIIDNALHWLRDYHFDGLRLDAVHALVDTSSRTRARRTFDRSGRTRRAARPATCLVAETDLNDPRIDHAAQAGGNGIDAQWNDDFHHALHTLLTGERQGYYADFGSIGALAKASTRRISSTTAPGRRSAAADHGRPVDTAHARRDRFVGFLQDHDQVGNRALGDRLSATLSPGLLRVGAALLLTSPFTPMLFMGEEWGASTPWQYFTDHPEPELGAAVRDGRRREFARHGWAAEDVPDPQDAETFARSHLDWAEIGEEEHRALLDWYRALIALRHSEANLSDPRLTGVRVVFDEAARWLIIQRGALRIAVNLADQAQSVPLDGSVGALLLASDESIRVDTTHVDFARIETVPTAPVPTGTSDAQRQRLYLAAESVAIVRMAGPEQ